MDARPQRSRTVSALLALAVVLAACQSADDASLVAPAPLPPATADPSEADDDRPAPEAAVVDKGPEAEEAEEAEQAAGDTASPSASAGFRLELGQDLSIGGVSPELIADPRGGYLLLTTGMSTDKAYRASDAITYTPDPSLRSYYQEKFRIFNALFAAQAESFSALNALERKLPQELKL